MDIESDPQKIKKRLARACPWSNRLYTLVRPFDRKKLAATLGAAIVRTHTLANDPLTRCAWSAAAG